MLLSKNIPQIGPSSGEDILPDNFLATYARDSNQFCQVLTYPYTRIWPKFGSGFVDTRTNLEGFDSDLNDSASVGLSDPEEAQDIVILHLHV